MSKNSTNRSGDPQLNKDLGIYELQIRDIILESNENHIFNLRFNELTKIDSNDLPLNINFILLDETTSIEPYLVNIKLILEKVTNVDYNLLVEESSIRSRWENESAIDTYFSSRIDIITKRQQDVFDAHIVMENNFDPYFFLQYNFYLKNVSGFQIVKMAHSLIKRIHANSEQLNNNS